MSIDKSELRENKSENDDRKQVRYCTGVGKYDRCVLRLDTASSLNLANPMFFFLNARYSYTLRAWISVITGKADQPNAGKQMVVIIVS